MNIEDIPDSEILVYTTAEYVGSSFLTVLSVVATACDILILFVIYKERTKSAGAKFIASLIVGDLLFSLVESIYGIVHLRDGGWSTGKIGCLWNAFLVLCGQCASILSLIILSFDRILVVKYHYYLSKKETYLIIASIWIISIVSSSFPIYTNSYMYVFGLCPSRLTCAVSWWDHHPLSILAKSIVIIVVLSGMILVTVVYSFLYLYYRRLNRERLNALKTTMMRSEIERQVAKNGHAEEHKLFVKCATITSLFFITWLPCLCLLLFETATYTVAPASFDGFACICVMIYSIVNAAYLIILDNRIKGGVREIMGPFFEWNSIFFRLSKKSPSSNSMTGSQIALQANHPIISILKKDQMATTVKIEK